MDDHEIALFEPQVIVVKRECAIAAGVFAATASWLLSGSPEAAVMMLAATVPLCAVGAFYKKGSINCFLAFVAAVGRATFVVALALHGAGLHAIWVAGLLASRVASTALILRGGRGRGASIAAALEVTFDCVISAAIPLGGIGVAVQISSLLQILVLLEMERRTVDKAKDLLVNERKVVDNRTSYLNCFSHELRLPLQSITAASSLLALQRESERMSVESRVLLGTLQASSENAMGLLDEFLIMSRIREGKPSLVEIREFDLFILVESVVFTMGTLADARDIDLSVYIDPALEPYQMLVGDDTRVGHILTNLLSNAIKYTEPGGHVVVIVVPNVAKEESAPGDPVSINFIVCDTGRGISPEFFPHLFDAFFREVPSDLSRVPTASTPTPNFLAEPSECPLSSELRGMLNMPILMRSAAATPVEKKPSASNNHLPYEPQSHGYGLAIVWRLVSVLGGKISVCSRVGVGSSFMVKVPLLRAPAPEDAPQAHPARDGEPAPFKSRNFAEHVRQFSAHRAVVVALRLPLIGGLAANCAANMKAWGIDVALLPHDCPANVIPAADLLVISDIEMFSVLARMAPERRPCHYVLLLASMRQLAKLDPSLARSRMPATLTMSLPMGAATLARCLLRLFLEMAGRMGDANIALPLNAIHQVRLMSTFGRRLSCVADGEDGDNEEVDDIGDETRDAAASQKSKAKEAGLKRRHAPSSPPTAAALDEAGHQKEAHLPAALVCDDNDVNRQLLVKVLEKMGLRVLQAVNGRAALELYKERSASIELILMDILMPVMGGLEAMQQIRGWEKEQKGEVHCAAWAVSGMTEQEDHEAALEAGFDRVLGKPLNIASLRKSVENVVGQTSIHEQGQ